MDEDITDLKPHPLDYSTLTKGSVILSTVLEKVVQCNPNHANYSLLIMNVADKIKTHLAQRGEHVVIKQEAKALRILTDEEATDYLKRANDRGLAIMGRTCRELAHVDRSQLSEDGKRQHEHAQLVAAHRVSGALGGQKKALSLIDYENNVPKLHSLDNNDDERLV